jgi:hypothetical protein
VQRQARVPNASIEVEVRGAQGTGYWYLIRLRYRQKLRKLQSDPEVHSASNKSPS